jgi:UDP-glucose 4-epimerase
MMILVTGGAGFIGSHTCVELLEHGHEVVVVDNYSNSSPAAVKELQRLAGRPLIAYELDLRDHDGLSRVFGRHPVDAVIHCGAKKAVRESLRMPVEYFDVNIAGTTSLLRTMLEHDVWRLVFSSSCSIYGDQYRFPIVEDDPPHPTNPYARSKLICEQILTDACTRHMDLSVIALRYFNLAGAHESGSLGEDPRGVPNNLMPCMMQAAVGRLGKLQVFGGDYPTPDGSGIRDYLHVMDVADAHRVAIEHLDGGPRLRAFNLGSGVGASVLQLVAALQEVSGMAIPYEVVGRQTGDAASLIADPSRIDQEWGWRATRDIQAMCRDAWHFQRLHPDGYTR